MLIRPLYVCPCIRAFPRYSKRQRERARGRTREREKEIKKERERARAKHLFDLGDYLSLSLLSLSFFLSRALSLSHLFDLGDYLPLSLFSHSRSFSRARSLFLTSSTWATTGGSATILPFRHKTKQSLHIPISSSGRQKKIPSVAVADQKKIHQ